MTEYYFNTKEEAIDFSIINQGVFYEKDNRFVVIICDGGKDNADR